MAGHGLPISKAHVQGGQWPAIAALTPCITREILFNLVGCNLHIKAYKPAFRPAHWPRCEVIYLLRILKTHRVS